MVVILVDDRALPRLARATAVAAKIIPPATAAAFSATTATAATLATSGLKIPARLTATTAAGPAFTATFAIATPIAAAALSLSLAATRSVAALPATIVLPRCGLGRRRCGCCRGWFLGGGDFFAQLREKFFEHR
jgi:hypothetical protein